MPKKITIPKSTFWNSETEEFIDTKEFTITIEHSLISISKWESKWHKPFLTNKDKTIEETLDYIKCMVVHSSISDLDSAIDIIRYIPSVAKEIQGYIEDPMTATTFSDTNNGAGKKEIVTSELIYYWMIAYGVPVEFEKWHLNRLLTLIHICGIKNSPQKKMGINDIYSSNRSLNAARRRAMRSRG